MEVNTNVQDDVLYVEIMGNLNNKTAPELECNLFWRKFRRTSSRYISKCFFL